MSYSVDRIVPFTTRFVPGGLSTANFGFATLFVPESEAPAGFAPDTYRDYTSSSAVADDGFVTTSESYKAADKWLGADPRTRQLRIYVKATADASYVDTYTKARAKFWWFITLNTIDLFDDAADTLLAWGWNNSNETWFAYTESNAAALIIGDATTVSSQVDALGYRFGHSTYDPTDRYASFPILNWFATVNYSVEASTITGEYKTIGNTAPQDLTPTEQNALIEKNIGFISDVDLQGQKLKNRYINSKTHSANDEYIDDVFNSSALINAIKVSITNVTSNAPTKLPQTPAGQQAEITATQQVLTQYLENRYLGPRNYIKPETGLNTYTIGYEILTRPEDILDISDGDRTERKSAPMVIRIFRAGAIHKVPVDLTIY